METVNAPMSLVSLGEGDYKLSLLQFKFGYYATIYCTHTYIAS